MPWLSAVAVVLCAGACRREVRPWLAGVGDVQKLHAVEGWRRKAIHGLLNGIGWSNKIARWAVHANRDREKKMAIGAVGTRERASDSLVLLGCLGMLSGPSMVKFGLLFPSSKMLEWACI